MKIEYDQHKNQRNISLRGLSFALVNHFDFDNAITYIDDRKDYGENRWIAVGYIYSRLYVLIYTTRDNALRVISLRKANKREVKFYEENK